MASKPPFLGPSDASSVRSLHNRGRGARWPLATVVVPARNEEKRIGACLASVLAQTYPRDRLEVLVVDGMSRDRTRDIVLEFGEGHPPVQLLDNPKRSTSEALNIGVQSSSGDVVIIVGAHSVISPHYVERAVAHLHSTDPAVAGVGPTLEHLGDGWFGNLVAHALSSPFGVGNSRFRLSQTAQFVDTIPYGAYRRSVFEEVGLWDTELVRNQDIEFNHRLRSAGFRLLLAPDMGCTYYTRTTLGDFARQNYGNGLWNVLTFAKRPGSLGARHFVPLAFLLGLAAALIAALLVSEGWLLLLTILLAYSIGALAAASIETVRHRQPGLLLLVLVFPVLHLTYGFGSLAGLAQLMWSAITRGFPSRVTSRQ